MLDRAARTLTLANGEQFPYDRLVLATGSVPFVPPSPAISGRAVSSIAPWEISPPSRDACAQARSGVVIGGGLLGLEAANALRLLGLKTQVVEFAPRLMPVQLDEAAAPCCGTRSRPSGSRCWREKATECIEQGSRPVIACVSGRHSH